MNAWVDKSVASADNTVFRLLLECLTTKGVKKHGLFFASGEKAVTDILERHPERVRDLIVCTDLHLDTTARDPRPKLTSVERSIETLRALPAQDAVKPSVLAFTKPLFDQLDIFGTHAPLLALSAWEIPPAKLTGPPQGLEILCALSDPSNLGALLRSAAAFGVSKLILLKESASPFHAKAVRAASAATFDVALARGPAILEVGGGALPLFALDMSGAKLSDFVWPKNARLLLGEEGRGVPSAADFTRVAIPMAAGVESLNATVAASIAMYTYHAQHQKT